VDPVVEIFLRRLQIFVDLFAEGNSVELIQDSLVEAFTDAVRLGRLGFRPCVVDVVDRQVQLVIVLLRPPRLSR